MSKFASRVKKALALAGAGGLLAVGGIAVAAAGTTAAANATVCSVSNATTYQAYNVNCSYAQVWNLVAGSTYYYGNRAGVGAWTQEPVCYANVTAWGVNKGVWVG